MLRLTPPEGRRLHCALLMDDLELQQLRRSPLESLKEQGASQLISHLVANCCTETYEEETRQTRVLIDAVVLSDGEYQAALRHAYHQGWAACVREERNQLPEKS